MRVTLECYGAVRDHLPDPRDRELEIETPGRTVADAVDAAGIPRRLVYAILVDGAAASLETEVGEGSRVTLMPTFAGG